MLSRRLRKWPSTVAHFTPGITDIVSMVIWPSQRIPSSQEILELDSAMGEAAGYGNDSEAS